MITHRPTPARVGLWQEHDPFGDTLRSTGPRAPTNPWRFSTKYTDQESGCLYYGYRYYAPRLGRWVSRDPLASIFCLPERVMVDNDPIGSIDSLGLVRFNPDAQTYDWSNRNHGRAGMIWPAFTSDGVLDVIGDRSAVDCQLTKTVCCWECRVRPFQDWFHVKVQQRLAKGVDATSQRLLVPVLWHEGRRLTIYWMLVGQLGNAENFIAAAIGRGTTEAAAKSNLRDYVQCIENYSAIWFKEKKTKWQRAIGNERQVINVNDDGTVTDIVVDSIVLPSFSSPDFIFDPETLCTSLDGSCRR